MKKTILAGLVLLLVASATAGVASAQANQTATATPSEQPDNSTLVTVGPLTKVTDWTYQERQERFRLVVQAKTPVLLTAQEGIPDDGSGAGSISFKRQSLAAGENIVFVDAPITDGTSTVVLSTPGGISNGRAAYIKHKSGSSFISGPYTGKDVRDAGLGSALGVVIAVLYQAVAAKVGASEKAERIA
jgi:hypothetical protein